VSAVLLMALLPAVVRAILLVFVTVVAVTVVAVLTHDKDRRKTALVVLRILAPNRMPGANGLTMLRNCIVRVPATTDERPS
jgi:hypothetical protein